MVGLVMSIGTTANLEQAVARPLAAPVAQARASGPPQAPLSLDEPGWRQGHKRAWRWGAVRTGGTVCVGRCARGGHVARELVGEALDGLVVSDRWSGDTW